MPRSVTPRTSPSVTYSHTNRLNQRCVYMRNCKMPTTANASGSTFNAQVRLPVGASHSSQARPSTISASRLARATARVRSSTASGAVETVAVFIAGIIG